MPPTASPHAGAPIQPTPRPTQGTSRGPEPAWETEWPALSESGFLQMLSELPRKAGSAWSSAAGPPSRTRHLPAVRFLQLSRRISPSHPLTTDSVTSLGRRSTALQTGPEAGRNDWRYFILKGGVQKFQD